MTRDDIASRLKAFLEETFPHQGCELTATTDLLNAWFVDSLGVIMTVVHLETAFGVEVTGADVNHENFFSIETLSRFVASRLHVDPCGSN